MLALLLTACASKPGPYDPPTRSDSGYPRFLTAGYVGELKKLYLSACSTRHTDPTVIKECWKDQYRSGLTIIQGMVIDGYTLPDIQKCMDRIVFPEGTPDLAEIVRKQCYDPDADVRNQSSKFEEENRDDDI